MGEAPSCEQVAATYHRAVGTTPGTYVVSVIGVGNAACRQLFSAAGAKLEDLPLHEPVPLAR
jgi:hypothetical protein